MFEDIIPVSNVYLHLFSLKFYPSILCLMLMLILNILCYCNLFSECFTTIFKLVYDLMPTVNLTITLTGLSLTARFSKNT